MNILMKNKRQTVYLSCLISVVVLVWLFRESAPVKLPELHSRAGGLTPASETINLTKTITYYRTEIRQKPEVVKNYVHLAQLYLQKARITGRHHAYLTLAREIVDEALTRDPDNPDALLSQASIFMKQHRFEAARDLAAQVTRKYGHKAIAWGIYSDALKELGRYDEAVAACDKMLSLRPDLRSYSRAAHLRELHGRPRAAKTAMKLAVNAGVIGLESHAWASCQLGNLYLNEGRLDSAAFIYNKVLDTRPDYAYALAGLAQIAAKRGQDAQAIQLLLQAHAQVPEHQFLEQLAPLYDNIGDSETARVLTSTVLDAYKSHEADGWIVDLEYAQFCLERGVDLDGALERIEREYARRPHNIDVLATYGWACYKTGHAAKGLSFLERALAMNPGDARNRLRYNLVARACDENEVAVAHAADIIP